MEESPRERFYLWIKSKSYGWTPIGNLTGYESVKELQRENEHYFSTQEKRMIMVMRATPYS